MTRGLVTICLILLGTGCSKGNKSSKPIEPPKDESSSETSKQPKSPESTRSDSAASESPDASVVPETTKETVEAVAKGLLIVKGTARIGLLYYHARSASRKRVMRWLDENHAEVKYHSEKFGYVDAEIDWKDLAAAIDQIESLGLSDQLMKLELERLEVEGATASAYPAPSSHQTPFLGEQPSSFRGKVHSAGFGAKVLEFREQVAEELGLSVDDIAGQGSVVAVYDGGIDLSRTDVFQNRMIDFKIGEETLWINANISVEEFLEEQEMQGLPDDLQDIVNAESLGFGHLGESTVNRDLNGSNTTKDMIWFVAYKDQSGLPAVRFSIDDGRSFGDPIIDFGKAHDLGRPQLVDLHTGRWFKRLGAEPSTSVAGAKLRFKRDSQVIQVALIGLPVGASGHGIANLHMVGGNVSTDDPEVSYQGVAPAVGFIGMQTWSLGSADYGNTWIPLARSMVQAAESGADVIDLDIYTPGDRFGQDLLTKLSCRIVRNSKSVPVVASHNFGPLPNTVQSLAQSPCVLGIGAARSRASIEYGGRTRGPIDPRLRHDDDLQTAAYSGRGFGLNGLMKPDVISPEYGYTAYNDNLFIRFGGTSGATPTTAGIIALLKQAARKLGVELDFFQVRFLLQAGSRAPSEANVRDGYGYTNLNETWKYFKKYFYNANDQSVVSSMQLGGHQNLQFEGQPDRSKIVLPIKRMRLEGEHNAPEEMKFWIEFTGDHESQKLGWAKFMDPVTNELVDKIAVDSPIPGQEQTIAVYLDRKAETWNGIPEGDYVALVKGVRSHLQDNKKRAVDFIQPISVSVGRKVENARFDLENLYADQHRTVYLKASVGDSFFVSAKSNCKGQVLTNGDESGLHLTIDNESFYTHASSVMNGYEPMVVGLQPINFVAKKSLVRLNIRRDKDFNCDGTFAPSLQIRKLSFVAEASEQSMIKDGAGGATYKLKQRYRLKGDYLNNQDVNQAKRWRFTLANRSKLILKKRYEGEINLKLPFGVDEIKVVPTNPKTFQGALVLKRADEPTSHIVSQSDSQYSRGIGSQNHGSVGLGVKALRAGDEITLVRSDEKSPSVVELEIHLPAVSYLNSAKVISSSSISPWLPEEEKSVELEVKVSNLESLRSDFPQTEWTYRLQLPLELGEDSARGTENAYYVKQTIWQNLVEVSLAY